MTISIYPGASLLCWKVMEISCCTGGGINKHTIIGTNFMHIHHNAPNTLTTCVSNNHLKCSLSIPFTVFESALFPRRFPSKYARISCVLHPSCIPCSSQSPSINYTKHTRRGTDLINHSSLFM